MKHKQLCILDMDGTILDTLDDLYGSVNAIMTREGFPTFSREKIRSILGHGLRDLMERSVPGGAEHPEFERMYRSFLAYYGEHANDHTKLYDGILDVVRQLKQDGWVLAIHSNKRHEKVLELVESYFGDLIDVPMGDRSEEGIALKPAPDAVFDLIKQVGVTPQDCVYIGDSEVDAKTAQNAGVPFIGVSWGFRDRETLRQCGVTRIADTALELLRMIQA